LENIKLSPEVPGRELETGELVGDRGFGVGVLVGGIGAAGKLARTSAHLLVAVACHAMAQGGLAARAAAPAATVRWRSDGPATMMQ